MRITGMLTIGVMILAARSSLAGDEIPQPDSAAVAVAAPTSPPGECHGCRHGESHLHQFLAWALYHPPAKSCCNCLPKPVPCCTPPLYTWFPCQGFGGCGPEGCTSCGDAAGPCKTDCYRLFHKAKE